MFESIVYKPEDVINGVVFKYWGAFNEQHFTYLQYKDRWNRYDSRHDGSCFTMSPRPEQIKKGIKYICLDLRVNSTIFIHTPGLLVTYPTKKITFFGEELVLENSIEVVADEIYYDFWSLRHDLHELKGKSVFVNL